MDDSLYDNVLRYKLHKEYFEGASKNEKRRIRDWAQQFSLGNDELYKENLKVMKYSKLKALFWEYHESQDEHVSIEEFRKYLKTKFKDYNLKGYVNIIRNLVSTCGCEKKPWQVKSKMCFIPPSVEKIKQLQAHLGLDGSPLQLQEFNSRFTTVVDKYLIENFNDNSCFFRAVSILLTGTENYHRALRTKLIAHMDLIANELEQLMDNDLESYLKAKKPKLSSVNCAAEGVEIFAMANMLNIDFLLFDASVKCWMWYPANFSINKRGNCQFLLYFEGQHTDIVTRVC